MIEVEEIDVWGFEHAIRGMRNPMNSWDKSDSVFLPLEYCDDDRDFELSKFCTVVPLIGKNDLKLMQQLFRAGTEHRKYLRQVFVSMDITAPLYWWKEFDTYKIGVISDSCSTMHKIMEKEFTMDDFSHEHVCEAGKKILANVIEALNILRNAYSSDSYKGDKNVWYETIQLLPSSYNQKRTITMSYENVFNMIRQRTGHKLDEWNDFVEILKGLPYVKEIGGF